MNTAETSSRSRLVRKLVGFVVIILLVPFCALGQQRENDSRDDELKGPVRKTIVKETNVSTSNPQPPEWKGETSYVTTYDPAGNRLQHDTYFNGKLWQAKSYGEIDGDRVVKEVENRENGPQRPTVFTVPSGKPAVQPPRDQRFTYKFKYKYDASGNRTEVSWVSNKGSFAGRDVRVYDDKGNKTKETSYDSNRAKTFTTSFSYDDRGNVIQSLSHSHYLESDTRFSYSYEFDAKGNWIKKRVEVTFARKEGKTSGAIETSQRLIEYD